MKVICIQFMYKISKYVHVGGKKRKKKLQTIYWPAHTWEKTEQKKNMLPWRKLVA